MEFLRSLSSPTAAAILGANTEVVPTAEIVPCDIVEIKTSDTILAGTRWERKALSYGIKPALTTIRLIEALGLDTDEPLLTGLSRPIQKAANTTCDTGTRAGDRLNIAISSSNRGGRGHGVVFAGGIKPRSVPLPLACAPVGSRLAH